MFLTISTKTWLTMAYGMFIISLAYGGIHIFDTSYPIILPSTGTGLALSLLLLLGAIVSLFYGGKWNGLNIEQLTIFLMLVMLSDIPSRTYNPFQLPFFPLITFLLITLLGSFFIISSRLNLCLTVILTFTCTLIGFSSASQGNILFSDDHPSFLYRLIQLRENFPNIPFYNPFWNSGVEAREFFPSGVLNVYFLFLPIIYLTNIICNYNAIIFILLFAICPLASYLAARTSSLNKSCATIAALLSLVSSLIWYRWALTFGTIGFITSTFLTPLAIACSVRLLESKRFNFIDSLTSILSISLVILWPLAVIAILPLALFILLRALKDSSNAKLLITLLILALIHLPWMLVFYNASGVGNFVSSPSDTAKLIKNTNNIINSSNLFVSIIKSALALIREQCESANPLILFLSIPGLLIMKSKIHSKILLLQGIWLILLSLFASQLKPHLEFDRFFLTLWHILVLPTSLAIFSIYEKFKLSHKSLLSTKFWLVSFLMGFIAVIPIQLFFMAGNKTIVRFNFANKLVNQLVDAINNIPEGGRVLFAGFILHELSEGHIAPLAALVNKPLIASSYQHNLWRYRDIIPAEFLKRGDQGISEYLDLSNVKGIITHDPNWRKYFTKRGEQYALKWRSDRFSIFERLNSSSNYFLEGRGEIIKQKENLIELKVDQPNVIIKFNYYNFLESNNCKINAYNKHAPLSLIALSECEIDRNVVIKGKSFWKRLIAW